MIIKPKFAPTFVVYTRGAEVRIHDAATWEAQKSDGSPSLRFTPDEALVLQRFLRYWLDDKGEGPLYHRDGVAVEYDL